MHGLISTIQKTNLKNSVVQELIDRSRKEDRAALGTTTSTELSRLIENLTLVTPTEDAYKIIRSCESLAALK